MSAAAMAYKCNIFIDVHVDVPILDFVQDEIPPPRPSLSNGPALRLPHMIASVLQPLQLWSQFDGMMNISY